MHLYLPCALADLWVDQQNSTGKPCHSKTHSHWLLSWEAASLRSQGLFVIIFFNFFLQFNLFLWYNFLFFAFLHAWPPSSSQLSLNNRPGKKAMWIDCGIHAREWISPVFCLWFVHHVSHFEPFANKAKYNFLQKMQFSVEIKRTDLWCSFLVFVPIRSEPGHHHHLGQYGRLHPARVEPWRVPLHLDFCRHTQGSRCNLVHLPERRCSKLVLFLFPEQNVEEKPLGQWGEQLHWGWPEQKLWCQLVQWVYSSALWYLLSSLVARIYHFYFNKRLNISDNFDDMSTAKQP